MAKDTGTKGAPGVVDTSNWERESIGFDPYWKPAEGESIVATLLGLDTANPKFHRYQMMAAQLTHCQRGPGDENDERHEKVDVNAGDTFNTSVYYSLEKPFGEFLAFSSETNTGVLFKLTCKGSTKTAEKQDVWLWDLTVHPKVKAALTEWRRKRAPKALANAAPAREQLQE